MDRSELSQRCPALVDALQADPALEETLDRLIRAGLEGALVRYLAGANLQAITNFLSEASRIDHARVEHHRSALSAQGQDPLSVDDVEAVPMTTIDEQRSRGHLDEAEGLDSLRAGRWASLAFAGGSGTRFFSRLGELTEAVASPNETLRKGGFDPGAPKGLFPISPVGGLTFYDSIVAEALQTGVEVGRLPWVLLLTSNVTHESTIEYLSSSRLWGFPAGGFQALKQADEPRLDTSGDLVIKDGNGHLAWTGDGHGGVYRALLEPGPDGRSVLDLIHADGVDQLVMHNVDNAAARAFSPARLGFHLREGALFTLSATRKVDPEEKVGVLMRIRSTGKVEVVEYNVIDPAIAHLTNPTTGRLIHEAGNINTNLVATQAIRPDIEPTLYTGKVLDSLNGPAETSSLEMLNQHLTRLLDPERVRAYEVDRDTFFMPTKNVTGVDSVASTVTTLSRKHAQQLDSAGARVDGSAVCDLHPACGSTPEDLIRRGIGPGWSLGRGSRLYLCISHGDQSGAPPGAPGLILEEGASLILDGRLPHGDLFLEGRRRLRIDTHSASRLRIGRNVVVKAGVRVRVRIGPHALLSIADGRVFDQDVDLILEPGSHESL